MWMSKVAGATGSPEPCEVLTWDTSFWGFLVARVRGDTLTPERGREIDTWCRRNGVSCLYFLARSDDAMTTNSAEDAGFHLADIRLTFRYRIADAAEFPQAQVGGAAIVRESCSDDIVALQRIAGNGHQQTRFYFDSNFPRERCRLLYETWIERSCGEYADKVLVAVEDDKPVGYISCHLSYGPHRATGSIGLVGVSSEARGRGLGRFLVTHALGWFVSAGVSEVTVVTQGRNYAAQTMYQRCGLVTESMQLWYHKWYLPEIIGS